MLLSVVPLYVKGLNKYFNKAWNKAVAGEALGCQAP